MKAHTHVYREETPVGELIFEMKGNKQGSAFRYTPAWMREGFAIDPHVPLREGWHHQWQSGDNQQAFLGAISDCIPDSWGRKLIAAQLGHQPNEFEALMSVNDATRIGALRFLNAQGVPSTHSTNTPQIQDLAEIQSLCQMIELGDKDAARALCGRGDSLGGARPKSDYIDQSETLYLAKYTTERDTLPITRMEVATLNLAEEVGLRAAKAQLALPHDPHPIALIERFDRAGASRIPYISAQSFIGAAGQYYSEIAEQLISTSTQSFIIEARELFERLLFTILVHNTDDHLKNHGLLYLDDHWVLSPLFDVNPQPERHPQLKTGISPSAGFEPSIEAAIEAADAFALEKDWVVSRIGAMATTIRDRWRFHCEAQAMTPADITQYAPAFEHVQLHEALSLRERKRPP